MQRIYQETKVSRRVTAFRYSNHCLKRHSISVKTSGTSTLAVTLKNNYCVALHDRTWKCLNESVH